MKPKPLSKTALLKDLHKLLEMHQYSGRTWELSVIRDAIKFLTTRKRPKLSSIHDV